MERNKIQISLDDFIKELIRRFSPYKPLSTLGKGNINIQYDKGKIAHIWLHTDPKIDGYDLRLSYSSYNNSISVYEWIGGKGWVINAYWTLQIQKDCNVILQTLSVKPIY